MQRFLEFLLDVFHVNAFVVFTDFYAADFSADCLWQFLDEFDYARAFVQRGFVLHKIEEFHFQFVVCGKAWRKYNRRFDCLAALFVRDSCDGTFHDGGMLLQNRFHFERADSVAGGFYDVVLASHEPNVAVLVHVNGVAGVVHAHVECVGGENDIVVISRKQSEWMAVFQVNDEFSDFACRDRLSARVHYFHILSRGGATHRAWAYNCVHEVSADDCRFGLTVAFVDFLSGLF